MNIHEYQGKALLRDYGVAVLDGSVAFTPEDAVAAAAVVRLAVALRGVRVREVRDEAERADVADEHVHR
ncbi:MAG: hypothetical protein VX152_12300, partial [Pseudomonadota bacterium]|nr:hypothetical protein [Pseudomonadota bacterium]